MYFILLNNINHEIDSTCNLKGGPNSRGLTTVRNSYRNFLLTAVPYKQKFNYLDKLRKIKFYGMVIVICHYAILGCIVGVG